MKKYVFFNNAGEITRVVRSSEKQFVSEGESGVVELSVSDDVFQSSQYVVDGRVVDKKERD